MTYIIPGLALAGNVLSLDGSFLFVFISIFILIFVLNRTLFRPINAVLDERDHLGTGRIAEARRLLADYDRKLNAYEEQLREARVEAYRQLEIQRREALAARQEALGTLRQEIADQVTAAREEIVRQAAGARAGLETEARVMAATISSRIMGREFSGGN